MNFKESTRKDGDNTGLFNVVADVVTTFHSETLAIAIKI